MSSPTILVVDDEPIITEMLSMLLEIGVEAEVITTNSPVEASRILQQRDVSLLLTDYFMPEIDGLQLAKAWREGGNTHPVILITGHAEEPEIAESAPDLEPFEVVAKPWNNERLLKRIETLLSESSED